MPDHLMPYDPDRKYTGGGCVIGDNETHYRADAIEVALAGDNAPAIAEALELGWITHDSRTFHNETLPRYAELRNAPRCAAKLRALGFPG